MDNFKVMDMPKNERPIEKLLYLGAESLTNSELLAIILRSGIRGENVSYRIFPDGSYEPKAFCQEGAILK